LLGTPWELMSADIEDIRAWQDQLESDQGEVTAAREALIETASTCFLLLRGARNYLQTEGVFKNRKKAVPQPVIKEVLLPAVRELRSALLALGLERRAINADPIGRLVNPEDE